MSDALIGVVIGGLIASIAPLATLLIDQNRWKQEKKLAYLQSKRKRLEDLSITTLERFTQGMSDGTYPVDMISDIYVMLPQPVLQIFDNWMTNPDKSKENAIIAHTSMSLELKKSLADIDLKITELVE